MKISVNGISVNYTLEGPEGAPVVTMSHSLATDLGMWDPTVSALKGRWRVLRYDTRGHGGTDAPQGAYTLAGLADDAAALLKALGIGATHWVGLSMGGMIGQTLALSSPGLFHSLTLCDTSSRVPADAKPLWQERIRTAETQGMEPLVEPTLQRWFTAPFRERQKATMERVGAMIRATPPQGYAGCCHAIAALDLTDRLGNRDPDVRDRGRGRSRNAGRRVAGHPRADQGVATRDHPVGGAHCEHGAAGDLQPGADLVPRERRVAAGGAPLPGTH